MTSTEFVSRRAAKEGARTGECLMERQLHANQVMLERADGTARLAVALIGGITVITGFTLTRGYMDLVSSSAILISILLGLAGVYTSLRVSVGTLDRRILDLGPDVGILQNFVEQQRISETEAHLLLINMYRETIQRNEKVMNNRSRLLVVASYLLAGSTTVFLGALFYIIGGIWHG